MNKWTRLVTVLGLTSTCLAVGCGGDKKGPRSPESNTGITETSAKEDMPPPPAKEAEGPKPADTTAHADGPGAAGGMIKVVAMKMTSTKTAKAPKPVELKVDGTVLVDGKPAAKIKGDQVDSIEGTSMATIGVSGGLVGNGVKSGFKFEGDDLVNDDGLKLVVGDDGAITASKDGKTETFAKADSGASAKRAALILAVLWMTPPSAPQGVPKPAGGATKTATPPAKK